MRAKGAALSNSRGSLHLIVIRLLQLRPVRTPCEGFEKPGKKDVSAISRGLKDRPRAMKDDGCVRGRSVSRASEQRGGDKKPC